MPVFALWLFVIEVFPGLPRVVEVQVQILVLPR